MAIERNVSRGKAIFQGAITWTKPIYRKAETSLEVGVFTDATTVGDLSDFTAFTLDFLPAAGSTASPVIQATATSGDLETLASSANWDAGTEQHLTLNLTGTQMSIDMGGRILARLYAVLYGTTSVGNVVLASGWINVIDATTGNS